jgi:hypothetical protein
MKLYIHIIIIVSQGRLVKPGRRGSAYETGIFEAGHHLWREGQGDLGMSRRAGSFIVEWRIVSRLGHCGLIFCM